MDIEFLQKNHADANDLDHKVTLCKVRSDILMQTASEEDLKYIESYYKWRYNFTLTDAMNAVRKDWIVISDNLELGWRFSGFSSNHWRTNGQS